jgi:hypothetical protein
MLAGFADGKGGRMATRIFLALSALIWLPYGLYCFFQPGSLGDAAGVAFTNATGSTELRAMYGGLQAAIGVVALAGALRPELARSALQLLLLVGAGLGGARVLGAGLDAAFSSYTVMAIGLELGTVAITLWLLRRAPTMVS